MSSNISTLKTSLKKIRDRSKKLRNERLELQAIVTPTDEQKARIEELRQSVNACRKEERFLNSRINLTTQR